MRRLLAAFQMPTRHIRMRIVLPFAVLAVLVAAAGSYLVSQMVQGSLQERFDNQLAEAGKVAADGVVRTEQHQLVTVRAMAATDGVPLATAQGDRARLRTLLMPLIANESTDWAAVVDGAGQPLFASAADPAGGGRYSDIIPGTTAAWWPVQRALGGPDPLGDKYASIVETPQGFVLLTVAPIARNGRTVGAALAGTYMGSLVDRLKLQALADVTVYDYTGAPIVSTFPEASTPGGTHALELAAGMVTRVLAGGPTTLQDRRSSAERDYVVAYGQLRVRGAVVGLYSVALPDHFILVAGTTTKWQLSLLFGIAIVAVLATGFVIAQRITAPVLRLVEATRALAAGDLKARSGVRSRDEIGTLASSFDRMAETIEAYAVRLREQYLGTVKALTSAIDARDPYTLGHSLRVGQLSKAIAAELGLPQALQDDIEIGGYLHDIGKIGVRDAILLKPDVLTPQERAVIEQHPDIGIAILASVPVSPAVLEFVHWHHERLDGSGYPDRRAGEELSIVARIAAVADMYDALTSERPYRHGAPSEEIIEMLHGEGGRLLDTRVLAALEAVAPRWEERVRRDPILRGFELTIAGEGVRSEHVA